VNNSSYKTGDPENKEAAGNHGGSVSGARECSKGFDHSLAAMRQAHQSKQYHRANYSGAE